MSIVADTRQVYKCHPSPKYQDNVRRETMEAARRMAGNPTPYRVNRRRPCPICGRIKWCLFDPLSGVCLCPRQADGALVNDSLQPIRLGELGFVHVHGPGSIYAGDPPPRPLRASKAAAVDPARLAGIAAAYPASGEHLSRAAGELGLPAAALAAFGLGRLPHYFSDVHKNCPTWLWPERTATGDVCGIGHRRQGDGEKRAQGHRGIILTTTHAADQERLRADIIARGRVIATEGFTDGVTAHAMGEVAIGRPSVSGGVAEWAALLLSLDLPASVAVFLLGENDQTTDGRWPGRDGATEAAHKLAAAIGYRCRVVVVMPPAGIKDLRAAWQAGFTTWETYWQQATILETLATPDIPCGLVADSLRCPNSHLQKESTVVGNWDRAPQMQTIRKVWASNPWDCEAVFGVAGRQDFSPVLSAVTCHKRSCPVCGPYWKLKTYRRFGYHVFAHDGELYADQVLDLDWPATVKEMRRRAKKLGVPLRYVAIRNVDNMLTVIASVYPGEVARPVEKGEALDLLKRAVDTASLEPRPVNSCREWRPLDKPEVERVSGGCSPSAFHATLKTWGATAEGGGSRFIKCDIPNLFLSVDKTLDTVKEADFWHEAWLRDTAGGVEADSFHVRAVEQRARVKAVVTCQHPPDQVKELPTFDGFVNRQCGVCGQWFPCRYAFTPARQNAAEGQIALATAETV